MLSSIQPNLLLSPSTMASKSPGPIQFNSISTTTGQLQLQPLSPAATSSIDEKSLKDCIDIINGQVDKLKHLNEFSNVLQIDNINAPSISGHTDFYYPNLTYQHLNYQHEMCELSKIKHIPMPQELVEQFDQMQMSCYMGLFTNITRAWITIDNLIFFWNYEDGSDICFYDNLSEPILAVELFVPKPGSFDEGVEYGLCLATNSQVVLLSIDFIRFTKGNGAVVNEMRFTPQPNYSISTDNIIINTIKSSKSTGRIFMGGADGSLYEFFYQSQTGWFSSQTKKINLSHSKFYYLVPSFFNFNDADSIVQIELDETRNVLYTRSENSTIQVFYLGPNGTETSKISYLTCASIATKAATLINSNDKHLFMPIVNISAIKLTESSKNISLVACTQYGIRLYFSITYFEQFNQQQQQTSADLTLTNNSNPLPPPHQQQQLNIVPSTFQLVHVRLPPNIDLQQNQSQRGGPICSAYANDGISLMIMKKDEHVDSTLLLNRDMFLLHSSFKESKAVFDVEGRVWAIEEIVPSLASIRAAAAENDLLQTAKSASGVSVLPKLTAEYFDLPRRFAMITPQGCFIWNKLRPVDQLGILLKESNGPNSEAVRLFFNKIYERSEACSLCLAVALLHSNDSRLYEWATQAYFIYSGEAEIRKKSAFTFGTQSQPLQTNYSLSGIPLLMTNQMQQQLQDEHQHQNIDPSMYHASDTTLYNSRFYQNQQQVKPGFNTIMNSPQQMSTPIFMRTKDQQSAYSPFRNQPLQQQFTNRPTNTQQPLSFPSINLQQQQQQHQQKNDCEVHFSGKHDAIYIYMSRLMAPIWDLKVLNDFQQPGQKTSVNATPDSVLFATFADISLQWYLNKLNELKRFIDLSFPHLKTLQHSYLTSGLFSASQQQNGANQSPQATNMSRFATQFGSMALNMPALLNLTGAGAGGLSEDRLAAEIENGSIFLIRQFLSRIIEILGLWKILDEHKFHFISSRLDKPTQLVLMSMQVRNFLLADNSLLEQLITALLYRYIDDNARTDLLNQSLKQACPSLYTNENALFSKGVEKLKQALMLKHNGGDPYERDRLLKEGVDLMKQLGYVANLGQVCEMLAAAECYDSVFELCLTAAERRDPQSIALYYFKKGEPVEDIQGAHFFSLRSECYKCMLDCLTNLVKTPSINLANTGHQQFPTSSSRQNLKEKLEDQIAQLIAQVMQTRDELAHVNLFNWMIQIGLEKKLVTLQSPFVETYLLREIKEAAQTKMSRLFLDLLWRHYDFKKDYVNAAKVLTALAEKYWETQISLKERVEYLTQAIVALNSSNSNQSVNDEIAELNDKKDVALLQEKIYTELSKVEPKSELVQEALIQLDSQLFDITKLFYEFSEKFDLLQCQLAIYKMARHYDTKAVEMLWKQIIANELDKLIRPEVKPSDLKNELTENIVTIAKEYVDDDEKYFPLTTLIDSLEFVSLSRGFEPEWGPNLLRKLNIPFDRLIHAYNLVYSQKDIKWTENLSRFINSIFCLVEIFTRAPNSTNETDKMFFIRSVKDLIPKYLTELNSINDDLSKELIHRFKTVNYILERM